MPDVRLICTCNFATHRTGEIVTVPEGKATKMLKTGYFKRDRHGVPELDPNRATSGTSMPPLAKQQGKSSRSPKEPPPQKSEPQDLKKTESVAPKRVEPVSEPAKKVPETPAAKETVVDVTAELEAELEASDSKDVKSN